MTPGRRFPQCRVTVSAGVTTDGVLSQHEPFMDISAQVLTAHTVKTLGAPNGTFDLALTFEGIRGRGPESLTRILVPDNTVLIEFDAGLPTTDFVPVMQGFVTSVGAKTTVSGPGAKPQRAISVRGQDGGKFLVRHELPGWLVTSMMWGDAEASRREAAGLVIAGPPGKVLRKFFDFVFKELAPAPVAVAQGIAMAVDPRLDDETRSYVFAEDIWLRQGKFWSLLRGVADQPWTELFADMTPLGFDTKGPTTVAPRYAIVARPHPFDRADWDRLRTTVLRAADVKFREVALSDDERVNLVLVSPNGLIRATADYTMDAILFHTRQFDRASMTQHGTQPLMARTMYSDLGGASHSDGAIVGQAANGTGPIMDALRARASQMWRWHSVNHRLYKGAIVVAGDPSLRIGERVQDDPGPSAFFDPAEDERRTYYVEKVVQDYAQDGNRFFTHLAVTRGQAGFVEARAPDTV